MAAGGLLDCWNCGTPLADMPLPVGRTEYCRACRAEIHVCRMCRFYDLSKARHCAEPVADPALDKGRANFCGYFVPMAGRFKPGNSYADEARAALDALFGPEK